MAGTENRRTGYRVLGLYPKGHHLCCPQRERQGSLSCTTSVGPRAVHWRRHICVQVSEGQGGNHLDRQRGLYIVAAYCRIIAVGKGNNPALTYKVIDFY